MSVLVGASTWKTNGDVNMNVDVENPHVQTVDNRRSLLPPLRRMPGHEANRLSDIDLYQQQNAYF